MEVHVVLVRIVISILLGGMIGYERARKNRPAGIRTHILVCLGAAIFALIQTQLTKETMEFIALSNGGNEIRVDNSRIIAQIVSGVGFLGAGTIFVHKQSITGLTTAASLWSVAGIGIATGLGYYLIASIAVLGIVGSLFLVDHAIKIPKNNRVKIVCKDKETHQAVEAFFSSHQVIYQLTMIDIKRVYDAKNILLTYELEYKDDHQYVEIITALKEYEDIYSIETLFM